MFLTYHLVFWFKWFSITLTVIARSIMQRKTVRKSGKGWYPRGARVAHVPLVTRTLSQWAAEVGSSCSSSSVAPAGAASGPAQPLGSRSDISASAVALRADASAARASASDQGARRNAINVLEAGMNAASSIASRRSLLARWVEFHSLWFGGAVPVFPITGCSLIAVSAMFKSGHYRSFANYLSRAKEQHIELGHAWTDHLDRIGRRCCRSVLRGIGPARQSAAYSVPDVFNLGLGYEPLVVSGPVAPGLVMILSAFFLLREVEAARAQLKHVAVDCVRREICWTLPVSKTDQMALGQHRVWGCVCDGEATSACPFCGFVQLKAWLSTFVTQME